MGWASGSDIMHGVIRGLMAAKVPDNQRHKVYCVVIETLEDHDWDTQTECLDIDPIFDKALRVVHPDWFKEDM